MSEDGSGTARWAGHFTAERLLDLRVAKGDRSRAVVELLTADAVTAALWRVGEPGWHRTDVPAGNFEHSTWLSADGRTAYSLVDTGGNELGHVHRSPLDAAGGGLDLTPDWGGDYTLRGGDSSLDGRLVAFVPVDEDGFHLVVASADGSGPPRKLYRNAAEAWYARLAADARYVSLDTTDHNVGVRRYAVSVFDTDTGERVAHLVDPDGGSVTATCFAPVPGDPRILVGASHGSDGFCRPEIWHPLTGEVQVLDVPAGDDPLEMYPFDWSADGRYVLLGLQHYAEQRLAVHDLQTGATTPVTVPPGGYWSPAHRPAFGPDGCVLVARERADTPQAVWRWSLGGSAERLLESEPVPAGRQASSVTFSSSDGTTIQAWLITPDGAGPHPTVVSAHGGPHWFTGDTYNPEAQAWVAEGFAFLDVNFRGSSGRGRAFVEQILGDIGHYELEDIQAAHAWLVERGIARADQIFVTGASYGGYLTLYALGRSPELWAGGLAALAEADWAGSYRGSSEALRRAIQQWFGGTPDELPDLYRERSPIAYAADIRAPIALVQAANDTRVPPEPMREFLRVLESLGKDVTVRWLDAGHGISPGEEWRSEMEMYLATARRALAGRATSTESPA